MDQDASILSNDMDGDVQQNTVKENDDIALEAKPEQDESNTDPKPTKKGPRFMVENVESPTKKSPKESAEFGFPDPAETIGFATHEAVPMTMFYRNASSVGENAIQRPTLKELHEGFDVLDEDMVGFKQDFSCKLLLGGFLNQYASKINANPLL